MKTLSRISFLLVALTLGTIAQGQSAFLKYGPVAGIQKNTGTTYQNSQAAAADVTGLYSGCTGLSTQYLAANNTCQLVTSAVSGANPTASVGLSTVNGSATTYMRSDAAPPLSQSIAPAWSGTHTFANTTANIILNNSGGALDTKNTLFRESTAGFLFQSATDAAPTTAVTSIFTAARSGTAWTAVNFGNATDNPTFSFLGTGQVSIAGGTVVGSPTGGNQGVGTINMQGCFVNGVACSTGGAAGANPTGTVGLTAVNGSAGTYMRSDAAPPLSQAISPTWTGTHLFNGALITGSTTAGWSFGQSTGLAVARIVDTTGTTGNKAWQINTNNTGTHLNFRVSSDDFTTTVANFLDITRSGATVTDLSFGNATNNPTYSFLGTGAVTAGGPLNVTGGNYTQSASVAGASLMTVNNPNTSASAITALYLQNNATNYFRTLFSSSTNVTAYTTNGPTGEAGYLYTTGSSPISFGTAGVERERISSTGNVTVNAPSSGVGLQVSGSSGQYASSLLGNTTGHGLFIAAGSSGSQFPLNIVNAAQTTNFMTVYGDGGLVAGTPTGGDKGVGTINAQAIYVNGAPVSAGASKFVAGVMTIGASSCTVAQNTAGISSCTFNSTGNVTVVFSSAFTAGNCVANATNATYATALQQGAPVTSGINVTTQSSSGVFVNTSFSLICFGN